MTGRKLTGKLADKKKKNIYIYTHPVMLSTLPTLWTDSLLSLVVCFTSVRADHR